jgi:hypothetical protein
VAECAAETDVEVREVFQAIDGDRLEAGLAVGFALAGRTPLRDGRDAAYG